MLMTVTAGADQLPPSARAAVAHILLDKCESDIENLKGVGLGLADAAQAYGKSEAEIQAMFARADASVPDVVPGDRQ